MTLVSKPTVLNGCQSNGAKPNQVPAPIPSPNFKAGRMIFSFDMDNPSGPEMGAEATILGNVSASAKANSSQTAKGMFLRIST